MSNCWLYNKTAPSCAVYFFVALFRPVKKSYLFYQPALDLFGDVVITNADVFLWVSTVAPRWTYSERAFSNYVRGYSVADKVRAAKLSGHWQSVVNRHEYLAPWHDRLAVDVIPRHT
jgi:hypothetical protein